MLVSFPAHGQSTHRCGAEPDFSGEEKMCKLLVCCEQNIVTDTTQLMEVLQSGKHLPCSSALRMTEGLHQAFLSLNNSRGMFSEADSTCFNCMGCKRLAVKSPCDCTSMFLLSLHYEDPTA